MGTPEQESSPAVPLIERLRRALLRDVWDLLRNTVLFTGAIILIDLVSTHLPWHVFVDPFYADRRTGYVLALLTLFGLPSVLLATLTSLAITTLSPYANPSLLLLDRRYPENRLERLWRCVVGRGNRFRWSLQMALYVSGSLFTLFVLGALGLSASFTPALVVVTAIAIVDLMTLLSYVHWIIGLRHPSRVIEYTLLVPSPRAEIHPLSASAFK